jgi:hypothetical protein
MEGNKMLTILLEVKNENELRYNFYNPAPSEFKKFPRSEKGISKAIESLSKVAKENNWITDYRYVIYEGKYHYSKKDMKPMFIVDKAGEVVA